ncbi:hypothetical protein PM082_000045 [Marasmius tenuissimus]|nr:hypothetical protein PM082_000045 [Marasmius tenuissimus]
MNGNKTSILFCDFEKPELPPLDAIVRAYDPRSLHEAISPRSSHGILDTLEAWRSMNMNDRKILVIGFFPHNKAKPLCVGLIMNYPLQDTVAAEASQNMMSEGEEDVLH